MQEDKDWLDFINSYYATSYDENLYKKSIASMALAAGHKLLEKGFSSNYHLENVLEVGSGTGEHFKYVTHSFDKYTMTDRSNDVLKIAQTKYANDTRHVFYEESPAEILPYEDASFDRVIASHVLEHIYMPHLAIKEWKRVLKPEGVLSILIPTDPSIGWQIPRYLGIRRKFLKQGLPYDYIMAREHVNSCHNLIAFLRYYFPRTAERWWPLPLATINFNIFFVAHCYKENV